MAAWTTDGNIRPTKIRLHCRLFIGGISIFFFLEQYNVKYVKGDSARQVTASAKCKTITTVLNNLLVHYTCQLSRLRCESHVCGPISHAWLKNVSCCHLSWHNFQKYVNSDPCKERKPCVKWINDNTFLVISDFWSEKHWERDRVYTCFKTSEDFGRLRTSSGIFGNDRVVFKSPSTPRIKISRLHLRKSWQV